MDRDLKTRLRLIERNQLFQEFVVNQLDDKVLLRWNNQIFFVGKSCSLFSALGLEEHFFEEARAHYVNDPDMPPDCEDLYGFDISMLYYMMRRMGKKALVFLDKEAKRQVYIVSPNGIGDDKNLDVGADYILYFSSDFHNCRRFD